jgi:hypothetical protein
MQVAVLLVSDGRDRISADGGEVDRAVTFLVDLADENAGKGRGRGQHVGGTLRWVRTAA